VATTREHNPGSPRPRGVLAIFVGDAGREDRLLTDPKIKVRRVPSLLDAIALVSSCPRNPGMDRVILLSPGISHQQGIRDFTEALRHVDRSVCVAHIGPCDPAVRALVDGVVGIAMEPDELRLLVETRQEHVLPEDAVRVLASEPTRRTRAVEIGDAVLVRKLLLGEDLLDAAVALIRARLPEADVQMRSPADPATPGRISAEVQREGRTIGSLEAEATTDLETLQDHAAWLGAWLTLEARHREQRIEALTDPLTGAWNRRYFERYLSMAIEQARQARLTVTVLVFDIDEFKQYNDAFGHAAGDEILRETVRLLRSVIRPSDRVCRIGGDEFAVIFYEPRGPRVPSSRPPESIYRLAKRFQSQISGHRFPKLGSEAPGTLTISGGLATYPWDGRDPQSLLEQADALAIQSKRAGKNVITLGPGAMRECVDPDDD